MAKKNSRESNFILEARKVGISSVQAKFFFRQREKTLRLLRLKVSRLEGEIEELRIQNMRI